MHVKNMKWRKKSQQIIEIFDGLLPDGEDVEKRKMFGYPCAFKNNNMFTGVHEENIFLRLSEQDREAFLKPNQARKFEPMPGRTMKEYVVVPPWMLENQFNMFQVYHQRKESNKNIPSAQVTKILKFS